MRGPTPNDVLAHVTLVTGKEEFLSERTVVGVRDAVRRHDQEAELSETQASGLSLAQLGEMAAPSLFSSTRCVVVRSLDRKQAGNYGRLAVAPLHGTAPGAPEPAGPACERTTYRHGEARGLGRAGPTPGRVVQGTTSTSTARDRPVVRLERPAARSRQS